MTAILEIGEEHTVLEMNMTVSEHLGCSSMRSIRTLQFRQLQYVYSFTVDDLRLVEQLTFNVSTSNSPSSVKGFLGQCGNSISPNPRKPHGCTFSPIIACGATLAARTNSQHSLNSPQKARMNLSYANKSSNNIANNIQKNNNIQPPFPMKHETTLSVRPNSSLLRMHWAILRPHLIHVLSTVSLSSTLGRSKGMQLQQLASYYKYCNERMIQK